jgi:hypothetical protein
VLIANAVTSSPVMETGHGSELWYLPTGASRRKRAADIRRVALRERECARSMRSWSARPEHLATGSAVT